MQRSFLKSEATKTNGAIKPCQRPSQKPATTLCWFATPLDWLAPGAHPARMLTNNIISTSKLKAGFIVIPPLDILTTVRLEKSQNGRCHQATNGPLPHAQRPPPGGYVQTRLPSHVGIKTRYRLKSSVSCPLRKNLGQRALAAAVLRLFQPDGRKDI